jgi:hypothetical protein
VGMGVGYADVISTGASFNRGTKPPPKSLR